MPIQTKILVIANRTAASDELRAWLQFLASLRPAVFTLVVPATPQARSRAAGATPAEREVAEEVALRNMQNAVRRLREGGLQVEGRVGDPNPIAAAAHAVGVEDFNEIVVSTLPPRQSEWLRIDAPREVERATGRRVSHVSASEAQA